MSEFKFEKYYQYIKLKNLVDGLAPEYPYTLNSDVVFTQNEIALKYKETYAKDNKESDKKGGSPYTVSVYMF